MTRRIDDTFSEEEFAADQDAYYEYAAKYGDARVVDASGEVTHSTHVPARACEVRVYVDDPAYDTRPTRPTTRSFVTSIKVDFERVDLGHLARDVADTWRLTGDDCALLVHVVEKDEWYRFALVRCGWCVDYSTPVAWRTT